MGVPQREPCLGTPTPYPSPQGGGVKITASEYQNPPCFSLQITGSMHPTCPARGAFRERHERWGRLRWALVSSPRAKARGRTAGMASAKPCGPDAPRAGVKFSSSSRCLGAMVSKSRSPGRARHKLENHCAGKAGVFPPNLSARVRISLSPIAHETAGAARTRTFPAPSPWRGANELQNSGEMPSRE